MSLQWITAVIGVLILNGQTGTANSTEAPVHSLKKCIQDDSRKIDCTDFKSDKTEIISYWPPGPYVIPMTRYGCPESSMHGWREGTITLTWHEQTSVHEQSNILDANFTGTDETNNVSTEQFFSEYERPHIFFPSTPKGLIIHLCYKYRSNASVDIGSWPNESYRIFGAGNSCPPEFAGQYSNIALPNISSWDSDGFLPDFKIIADGDEDMLQIKLCSRSKSSNNHSLNNDQTSPDAQERFVNNSDTTSYRIWTTFFLIKKENTPCPKFQNAIMFEETVFIEQFSDVNMPMLQLFDSMCFYDLETDAESWLFETRRKNAYSVTVASTSAGNRSDSSESKQGSEIGSPFAGFLFGVTSKRLYHFWNIFDLGRTLPVSAIDIDLKLTDDTTKQICDGKMLDCFISREKWSFLYSKATSCLYVPYCRTLWFSVTHTFKRVMEGRYLILSHKKELSNFDEVQASYTYTVDVFTEMVDYGASDSCNTDLGMYDHNIDNDQISASSWLPEFTPAESRPYSSGWCPQLDDSKPYLKVVFPLVMVVEGLSVYYSREVIMVDGVQTLVSFGGPLLTLSYSVGENSTFSTKILRPGSSNIDVEAHTFWFLKHIEAKVITLSVEKDISVDFTCLRLELHGCRQNSEEKLQPASIFVRKMQSRRSEIVSYTSEVNAFGSVLTSIGFPEHYQSRDSYKWIVRFSEWQFIKLVFTHIYLSIPMEIADSNTELTSSCADSIIISDDLVNIQRYTTRAIDYRFNNVTYSLSVDTKDSQIVLTFITCPVFSPIVRGNGFRAYATYHDVPTCFSTRDPETDQWHKWFKQTCRHPSMFITSMSYLGFPFIGTTEEWTIHIPSRRINLTFLEFNVYCKTLSLRSEFKLTNMLEEQTYCNYKRPPDSLNSSSDTLTILFFKSNVRKKITEITYIEGFKIFYTTIEEPERRFIDIRNELSEIRNVALYKEIYRTWDYALIVGYDAFVLIDGITFPEHNILLGSCFVLKSDKYSIWWLLDLLDIYALDYIVFYGAIRVSEFDISENCTLSLGTGIILYNLQTTGIICGKISGRKVMNQKGLSARFIRLQPDCNVLSLCEVQVYGKLESLLTETATNTRAIDGFVDLFRIAINGEWGLWTAWSENCFCDGKQYRHRLCDDPKPEFSGSYCPGENVSFRPCKVDESRCAVYTGYLTRTQETCRGYMTGNNGFSNWSRWGACSSECGHGLMTRTRTCIIAEHRANGTHCVGDFSEETPCFGNEKCEICSNTFLKCYIIVAKYTNWEQAQLECFKRNMTLVSMLSLSEMRFVKYLLRERRHIDGLPNNYFDADFYTHIGLKRSDNLKQIFPVWENGRYAIYFTAWKKHEVQTSDGSCTRMNFKLFDDDNTWESVDCKNQMSEYTMCEYQTPKRNFSIVKASAVWNDVEKQEIPEQISPAEYDGDMNVTVFGKNCANSYCRDTLKWGYLHCKDVDSVFKECSVKLPPVKNSSAVYRKYLGNLNTTFSGKTCQRWDATIPHLHTIHGDEFQGEGISDAANNCRDIGDAGFLWCFTDEIRTRWEPCLLNEIKAERQCITKHGYTGTTNSTITGKICIRWDKQIQKFKDSSLFEENITNAENYCRDPLNFGFSWCYIESSSEDWEPCHMEETETIQDDHDYYSITPSGDDFVCINGKEIPQYLKCDGKFDCEDKSDETVCSTVYTIHAMIEQDSNTNSSFSFEEGSYFKCKSGEWISIIAICDTVIDCLDASDESICTFSSGFQQCTNEQFQCDEGDCIHISQVCNFIDDCLGASDEYCDFEECSILTEYRCENRQCIPLEQRCDAVKQCLDGSDETQCETCQSNAFHCDFGDCIPMRLRCDSFQHCKDGADEMSCEMHNFLSCQDVWDAGYSRTGYYTLGNIEAYCKFDDVYARGSMTTVLNFDVSFIILPFWFVRHILNVDFYNIYNNDGDETYESRQNFLIYDTKGSNCTQQVIYRCLPTYEAMAHLTDDLECNCTILNFKIQKSARWEDPDGIAFCPTDSYNNLTLTLEKPLLRNPDMLYSQNADSRSLDLSPKPEPFMQITAGPAICIHDFTPADREFSCNGIGTSIPGSERCVYDIDTSGFPSGCTDGSHLINCETYDCPRNTLKCPASYCIPHRFVCDGTHQCPGGEDEKDCGCVPTRNDILIISDATSSDGPIIAQFARLFYTQTNIVRVLSYKASNPLQRFSINDIILEVHDIEISKTTDIEAAFECHYKVFAKSFLQSIRFTNNGIKGIILIQNSEISKEVFKAIVESRLDKRDNFRIYRVSQHLYTFSSNKHELIVSNVTDIRVRRWQHLNGIGPEYFSELCRITTKVHCPNRYKCSSSKVCIPMEQVCDGQVQCMHGDDEVLCNMQCPTYCNCTGYIANCSDTDFNPNKLYTISKNTRYIDFSFNRRLGQVLQSAFLNFTKLSVLNMSACNVKQVSQYAFYRLTNLISLDLSFNNISVLSHFVFGGLTHLKNLNLRGNYELRVIETNAFFGLSLVQELDLANAKVLKISADTFKGMKLKTIDLSNNNLQEIEQYAFRDAYVENVNFDMNDIGVFHKEIFTGLVGLKTLKTPSFKFCCIRPNYVSEQECYPHKDEFSSCDDLMRHSGLQFMIWLIGVLALLGNSLSIIYRIKYDRERLKLGFGVFVTNLAMADFLMAVYLLIIAVADSAFRKRYIYVDDYWRHSVWCNIAGVLSTVSSEASVLFLCFITLDRLLVIKFPFGGAMITTKKAIVCVVSAWLFAFFVALLPIAYKGYFKDEFYSKSGVCIALPLTRDRPPGWAYSLAVFIGLNFVTFILVALGQLSIFHEVRQSSGIATSAVSTRKRDLKVARNLLFVVAHDFLCWFPIGVMGMLALSGRPVSGEVYAWAAVLILPVNSALNPLLYTLSAIVGAKSFNPSTDEQSFIRITKEIGENSLKCMMACHHFFPKTTLSAFRDINTLSTTDVHISAHTIIKIAGHLALCLDSLHCSSLGINPLDGKSVLLGVRNTMLTGTVKVKGRPFISYKAEDKQTNIYQLGMIMKSLIAAKKTKASCLNAYINDTK